MAENSLKVFIGLHRVVNYIDREISKVHKDHGLTMGQFGVLEVLYHKGDLSIGEVQDKILSSSGTIPVIVGNLEKRGLIEKRPDSNDRRKTILSLTDKGTHLKGLS